MFTHHFQRLFFVCSSLVAFTIVISCNPDEDVTDTPGGSGNTTTLSTLPVSNITGSTAVTGGSITSDGGAAVTLRGVVWSTTPNPTLAHNSTNDGSGVGSFTSSLSGLTANTTYYVRAYAIRSEGTAYGNEVSFTTAINLPTLITLPASSITASSAYSGGDVLTHGGTEVMQRGVVWSTAINPTLDNNFTVNGSGMGIYPSNLVDLIANTVYYIRAYAINEAGIAYGNELSFTTQSNSGEINSWLNPNKNYGTLIDQSGNTYATIFIGGQEWMAENLRTSSYSNGEPIPNVTSSSAWDQLNTGAWVHYNNESQNEVPFGKLYNWYTVADPRNVCPSGWHVPSDAEWSTLINYMDPNADGGDNWNSAGGKLKSTDLQYWNSPNTNATNESGFSALPGGYRGNYGNFYYFVHSYHWSSSAINTSSAYLRILHYDTGTANRGFVNKKYGYSVRCLRD